MTLWILFCRMSKDVNTLFPFYAKDSEHAEWKAEELLREHPSYERLELKEYSHGFRIVMTHLPGRIEEDVSEMREATSSSDSSSK
jgi:hypothetical protein